jgi:alpha-N-arabinofuranosidase
VFKDAKHFYTLVVTRQDGRRVAVLRMNLGSIDHRAQQVELAPGPVTLRISGNKDAYAFSIRQSGADWKQLGVADTRYLSSVTAGGFTGVYIGLYASGNGKPAAAPADFDWFSYEPKPAP